MKAIMAALVLILGGLSGLAVKAQDSTYPDVDIAPVFDDDGALVLPKGFRFWVFLGSPITPNGLNDGAAGFPEFHNVYVQRGAFDHYRKTGEWPEGTTLVKELQLVKGGGKFKDGSRIEPSGRGYFPAAANGVDLAVKDSKRFASTKNWGYFTSGHHAPPYAASMQRMPTEACAQCHIDNAGDDMVYDEFYKAILTPLPTQ